MQDRYIKQRGHLHGLRQASCTYCRGRKEANRCGASDQHSQLVQRICLSLPRRGTGGAGRIGPRYRKILRRIPAAAAGLLHPGRSCNRFTRMLYSCLVDGDFLDTEALMYGQRRASGGASMEQLWDKPQSYISGWFPPKGELNRQCCEILERCMQAGEVQQPRLFSLPSLASRPT